MGPMGHPEGVVDIGVVAVDELVDEVGVVGALARVESEVVEELHLRSQLGQPVSHRRQVPSDIGRSVGASQMGAGGDVCAPIEEIAQCREGGPDPEIVADRGGSAFTAVEWHVEVHPDQHAGSIEWGKIAE